MDHPIDRSPMGSDPAPARCWVCDASVHRNDDAIVCIPCGGRNVRIDTGTSWVTKLIGWLNNG